MILQNRLIILFLLFISVSVNAQESTTTSLSPLAQIRMRYKDAYVKITYSQPQKRGREIFGKLVPYGQIWRTGANEATEITLTRDMQVNGQLLKAGTYSLFTIPDKDKWTIIINSEPGLWGSYNYNPKLDVMKFDVPVSFTGKTIYESFTMKFDQNNELATLYIMWDDTSVSVSLKFLN